MKEIIVFVFLVSPIAVLAQQDSVPGLDSIRQQILSNHTELGKTAGEKNTFAIGTDGGTARSADGKMELRIPPGALDSAENISVQPVSNMINGGTGNAYACEPGGLQFKKPAQLIIHFPDTNLKYSPPSLQTIYWQDNMGNWHPSENPQIDTLNKTVSCTVKHFTAFGVGPAYKISPDQDEVSIFESMRTLSIWPGRLPDAYQPPAYTNFEDAFRAFTDHVRVKWFVNDIEGGNSVYGTIKAYPEIQTFATYRPPKVIPLDNPVVVKATFDTRITLNDTWTLNTVTLYSFLTLYAKYRYTFYGISESGKLHMYDSSSCDIKIDGKTAEVSNIKNYPASSDWPEHPDGCNWTYTNKDTWKGLVQIAGAASIHFTGATESNPKASVSVNLVPAYGNTPAAKMQCPGGPLNVVPSFSIAAMPSSIQFDIDGSDIIIHYGNKTGTNELKSISNKDGFIIYVRPLRF